MGISHFSRESDLVSSAYHFERFLGPQQVKHRLQMLLDVAAAADRRLTGGELIRYLTEASTVAALKSLVRAQHQHRSLAGEVAFV